MAFVRIISLISTLALLILLVMFGILRQEPSTASWIVFASDSEPSGSDLIRLQPETGSLVRLTNTHGASAPQWSPSGDWIAFLDGGRLYRIKPDGSHLEALTDSSLLGFRIFWSPDEQWLYVYGTQDQTSYIYRVRSDGSAFQMISELPWQSSRPSISPDGQWLAISYVIDGHSDIYRLHSDGSQLQQLSTYDGHDSDPIWSPDGHHIAFTSDRIGNFDLYLMRADGSNVEQIASDTHYKIPLTFSPDNQWLVYMWEGEAVCVESVELKTRRVQQLYCSIGLTTVSLSPDGHRIVFDPKYNTEWPIGIANIDGSGTRLLDTADHIWNWTPTWSPPIDLPYSPLTLPLIVLGFLAITAISTYHSS